MTNSERKKLAQKKAFEKKQREFKKWNYAHKLRIEEEKQREVERLKELYNDDLNESEKKRTNSNNCLFMLKKDFKISYSYMADLFGYKKGYLYSFTYESCANEVPLPLQRFCLAYRKIKALELELQNYNKLKRLLAEMLGVSIDDKKLEF